MLFAFGPRSALLLPLVVPGLAAALWLLGRFGRRRAAPDALLALLLLVPTFSVARWMLGYAGWFDSHDGYSTFMFYWPWDVGLALGPAYYLYFKSLTNQEFSWRQAWPLLPGLTQALLRPLAAAYDLLWWRGVQHRPLPYHFGTQGVASKLLDNLSAPLDWLGLALLLGYGLRVLADYRRYRHYLNDNFSNPERLRFAGLRQLLLLQAAVLTLNLVFLALNAALDFSYDAAWNFYALQGILIYGLIVVGIQANYAAASSPLLFEAGPQPLVLPVPETLPAALGPPAPAGALGEATQPLAALPIGLPPPAKTNPAPPAQLAPELQALRTRLLALMAAEQPWLEPELTLAELAQRLRTNPSLLSKVINQGCGQNFNDFVNGYRVAEARRKLADPHYRHYSLVGVALESGFNSKSTFNRVFKKLLGQAPSEVVRPKS
ncbi:helix-turn-helix transcriptional regulator [Hymenobacter sp. RP-2-7]|uniref:Helix-turn-helix transcriptional regulator n=1 Tax=Hymenobacter polaris TaxID=2682546 RepID=A0A7Y0AE08_9BACT|nr:helix-turn-helix transcriptional regulator [Hymenobacter polaris]NML65613.1 helix-turn-helix transcriptional regulator [Hymenobacter polaris]